MGVDADILTLTLSGKFAMGMAVDVPGAVMGFVPHLEGVVTADDQLFFSDIVYDELKVIVAASEKIAIAGMVVISQNQMMLAVETLEDAPRFFRRRK